MYTVLAVLPTGMCFGDLDCSDPIPSSRELEVGMSRQPNLILSQVGLNLVANTF